MNHELFLVLLLAHLFGDFYCQSDVSCADKRSRKWKSPYLYLHSIIIGLLSFAAVWQVAFLPWMLVLVVSHVVLDGMKAYGQDSLHMFLLDQILHIAVITVVSIICTCQIDWLRGIHLNISTISVPLFIAALLLCLKPANLLVKYVLERYHIYADENRQQEPVKVGALIGSLERSLFLLFSLSWSNIALLDSYWQQNPSSVTEKAPPRRLNMYWRVRCLVLG